MRGGFCDASQLGHFILDLPSGKSINDTSFYSARVAFGPPPSGPGAANLASGVDAPSRGLWDNPAGNPDLSPEDAAYSSPWKRQDNPSPSDILYYKEPLHYHVGKTGYYCVGMRFIYYIEIILCH